MYCSLGTDAVGGSRIRGSKPIPIIQAACLELIASLPIGPKSQPVETETPNATDEHLILQIDVYLALSGFTLTRVPFSLCNETR